MSDYESEWRKAEADYIASLKVRAERAEAAAKFHCAEQEKVTRAMWAAEASLIRVRELLPRFRRYAEASDYDRMLAYNQAIYDLEEALEGGD